MLEILFIRTSSFIRLFQAKIASGSASRKPSARDFPLSGISPSVTFL